MPDLNHTNLQEAEESLLIYINSNFEDLKSLNAQKEMLKALKDKSENEKYKAEINNKIERLDGLTSVLEKHRDLSDSISEIDKMVKKMNTPDKNGVLPKVNEEMKQTLQKAYMDTFEKVQAMKTAINGANEKLESEEKEVLQGMTGLIGALGDTLARDMHVFEHYKPEQEACPLKLLMEFSRTHVVDLTDKQIDTVGDAMSVRMPFKFKDSFGNMHDGFFTQEKHVDFEFGLKKLIQQLEKENSIIVPALKALPDYYAHKRPNMAELTKNLTEEDRKQTLLFGVIRECYKKGSFDSEKLSNYILHSFRMQDPEKKKNYSTELNAEAKRVADLIIETLKPVPMQNIGHFIDNRFNGTRIDSRNAAMSVMADLLGKRDLLARSVPMKVKINGTYVNGTFMENAKGVDPNRAPQMARFYTLKQLNTGAGLKSLADLQIIDFLCANTDRHGGNMFFQFDKNGSHLPADHTFKGVQGIDNDNSFGVLNITDRTKTNGFLAAWDNMRVMSQSMANTINALDSKKMAFMLQGLNLTDEEIAAAQTRLSSLKQFIREDVEYFENLKKTCDNLEKKQKRTAEEEKTLKEGKDILSHNILPKGRVSILNDEDFNKLTLNKLNLGEKQSIFKEAASFVTRCNLLDNKKTPKKAVVENKSRVGADAVLDDSDFAVTMYTLMVRGTKKGKKVSDQYKALQEEMLKYAKFCNDNCGAPMSSEYLKERNARLNHLVSLADAYLEFKKNDGFLSFYAKDRIKLVTKIRKQCQDSIFQPTEEEEGIMKYFESIKKSDMNEKRAKIRDEARESLKPEKENKNKLSDSASGIKDRLQTKPKELSNSSSGIVRRM